MRRARGGVQMGYSLPRTAQDVSNGSSSLSKGVQMWEASVGGELPSKTLKVLK